MKFKLQIPSALVLSVLFCGCGGKKEAEPLPPRPVITFRVTEPVAEIERSFSGVTTAAGSVQFGFEVGGRIVELNATAGKSYKKDDVLAKLDASNMETSFRLAEAQLESSRTAIRDGWGLRERQPTQGVRFRRADPMGPQTVSMKMGVVARINEMNATVGSCGAKSRPNDGRKK